MAVAAPVRPVAQGRDTARHLPRRQAAVIGALVLAGWAAVIVVARIWGFALRDEGHRLLLNAAPLVGLDGWAVTWRAIPVVGLLAVGVAAAPRLATTLAWRRLAVGVFAAAVAFALALAFVDGVDGITDPTLTPSQYLHDVPAITSIGGFLDGFVEQIDQYHNHVRAHPPGMILVLWALDQIGLGGPGWAAALYVVGGAAAMPAVLIGVREVAGESVARRAAPFVVFVPVAIWVASTPDAFFAGVAAWATALVIVATGRTGRRSDAYAVAGGLLFGAVAMLSYGLVLTALVPAAVAAFRRRLRPLVLAAAGPLLAVGLFALAGFWYLDGFAATRGEYAESVAETRPYRYFLVANVAALGLSVGPAVAVGLAWLRDRRLWLVVGGALAAVVVANLSGFSKGEVERIWLPFTVWLIPAAAVLEGRGARAWLALNGGFAVLLQLAVRTPW